MQPITLWNFQDILWSIRQLVDELNSSNIETLISWVGGHIDLKPNDLADDLVKKAAEEARGLTESPPLSYSEFKNLIKVSSLKKWHTIPPGRTNFKSIASKLGFQKLAHANVVIQYKMKNT